MKQMEMVPKSWPSMLIARDWTKRRCFVRSDEKEFLDKLHDLKVRDDDVWVVTLPKCGTTWMQELLWLLQHDCDFQAANSKPLELRSPFVEFPLILGLTGEQAFQTVNEADSPRLIKTHLPLPLLPRELWIKKPKTIYVFRNPKDAMVSSYYFGQNFGHCLNTPLEEVIMEELELELKTESHWNHVLEFWQLRTEDWIYYTSFESMKKDLRSEIERICKFLNKPITEEQMKKMLKHLSFEEMKNNPHCNHVWEIETVRKHKKIQGKDNPFMRKGKVGAYKEELSTELIKALDEWIANSLSPHNVTLDQLLLQ